MLVIVQRFIILVFLSFSGLLGANVEYLDHSVPELISSADNLGMGNANFGEDFGPLSVFLNPASRLSQRRHKFGLFNFNGEFSADTFAETFGKRGLSFGSFQQGTSFLSQTTMRDSLINRGGGILYQRMGVASFYQFKRFTIGHFSSHYSNGALKDDTSTFYGNRREDHGPYINFTKRLGRRFIVGFTYVYLKRSETLAEVPAAGNGFVKTYAGNANHLILGLKYQFTRKFIGSLVARDALNSNYFNRASSGTPRNDKQTIDVAFTGFLSRNKLKINLALRDITSQIAGIDASRKVQLGIEYKKNIKWGFRFGVLEAAPTLGWFYQTRDIGKFSLSTYAVDTSATEVRNEDRRLALEYSL